MMRGLKSREKHCYSDLSTFGSDGMEDALFYDDVDEPNVEWNERNQQDVLDLDFQEPDMVNIARRQLIPGKEHHNLWFINQTKFNDFAI